MLYPSHFDHTEIPSHSALLVYLGSNIKISITESQTGWGWQEPWEPSGLTSVPAGTPEQGAQAHVQVAYGDLQGGDSTTSQGNLSLFSVTWTALKYFLMLRGNLLCSSLCPLPLFLALGNTGKNLVPTSLHLPCFLPPIYRQWRDPPELFLLWQVSSVEIRTNLCIITYDL